MSSASPPSPTDTRCRRCWQMKWSTSSCWISSCRPRMGWHSRDQLLDMSRLHNDDVYNRSVNTQVMRLRHKLETDPSKPRYILTERSAGYVFSVAVEIIY